MICTKNIFLNITRKTIQQTRTGYLRDPIRLRDCNGNPRSTTHPKCTLINKSRRKPGAVFGLQQDLWPPNGDSKRKELIPNDLKINNKLYYNQRLVVGEGTESSTETEIGRGVRQDCVL